MKKKIIIVISIIILIGIGIGTYFIIKTKDDEEIVSTENGNSVDIESTEYQTFDNLINSIIGNSSTLGSKKTTTLVIGDKITINDLTEDEIFLSAFRYVYGSDKLVTKESGDTIKEANNKGYASTISYEINVDTLKEVAKNIYNKELTNLPNEFINGSEKYTLSNNVYVGRILDNTIDTIEHEYYIESTVLENNSYIITVNVYDKTIANDTSMTDECLNSQNVTEDCALQGIAKPLVLIFTYTKSGENYTFVSVERTT